MDWDPARVAAVWAAADSYDDAGLRAEIEAAVVGAPADVVAYERGSAFDSTGDPERAVGHYREALAAGLSGSLRRQATIQLASSLRNLGEPEQAVELLTAELAAGSDELDDAVRGFLALALTSLGRDREAAALALGALAPHLPRYQRSLAAYAREL